MRCTVFQVCILLLGFLAGIIQAAPESSTSGTRKGMESSTSGQTAEPEENKSRQEERSSKKKQEEEKREPLLETDEELIKKLAALENEARVDAYIKKHPEEVEGIDENRLKEKAASYRQLQKLLPRMRQYVEEPPLDL